MIFLKYSFLYVLIDVILLILCYGFEYRYFTSKTIIHITFWNVALQVSVFDVVRHHNIMDEGFLALSSPELCCSMLRHNGAILWKYVYYIKRIETNTVDVYSTLLCEPPLLVKGKSFVPLYTDFSFKQLKENALVKEFSLLLKEKSFRD